MRALRRRRLELDIGPCHARFELDGEYGPRPANGARSRELHDARGATMPYLFLGPARYVPHHAEKPVQIVWALDHPMPPDFYRDVKIAAG